MKRATTQKIEEPKPLRQYHGPRGYLQTIIDSLDDELLVIDRHFRITQANAAVLRRHGLLKSEVVGQHCYAVSHGTHEPCRDTTCECPLTRVLESGQQVEVTHTHLYVNRGESE